MENIQRKALSEIEWKADKPGTFRAVVATYNVVDHDGDVTLPGALDTSKKVIVSPYNHSSIDEAYADMPVGAATITTVGDKAVAEGRFYTDTDDGRKAWQITKALYDDGLGEWSYGFRIPAGGAVTDPKQLGEWPGAVRILKAVAPFEVSLVFAGAGIGTQTVTIKGEKRGARLSKDTVAHLRALADYLGEHRQSLLAFIGESEELPDDDPPKALAADASIQSQLRVVRDFLERERSRDRFIDVRLI